MYAVVLKCSKEAAAFVFESSENYGAVKGSNFASVINFIIINYIIILFYSASWCFDGQGRQEETFQANFFWTANLCTGKNFRTDQISGRSGESAPGLLVRDDGESSQGRKYAVLSLFLFFYNNGKTLFHLHTRDLN